MQDILTEAEATNRRCPFRFRANTLEVAQPGKKELEEVPDRPCIAGLCMAWRLAHKDSADGTERGYCGAFGEPKFT